MSVIKKINSFGRVVIPAYMRDKLGVKENDPVDVDYDAEQEAILIKKHRATNGACKVCGKEFKLDMPGKYTSTVITLVETGEELLICPKCTQKLIETGLLIKN